MADQWFVEERKGDKWSPVIYHGDKPTEKKMGGGRHRFRADPVKIKKKHHGKSLDKLQKKYGKGKDDGE